MGNARGITPFGITGTWAPDDFVPSPNYGYPRGDKGRNGHAVVAIVDHIAEGSRAGVLSEFANAATEKSSTFLVCKDGTIIQFVPESDSAWANGIDFAAGYDAYKSDLTVPWIADCWRTQTSPNEVCISIEHEGLSGQPFLDAQYQATLRLHRYLVAKHAIPVARKYIVGHYRLDAVNRPFCPGLAFPWEHLFLDLS